MNIEYTPDINEYIYSIPSIRKILSNLHVKFHQFMLWLGCADLSQKPNDFCKIILDFTTETNKLVQEFEKEPKRQMVPDDRAIDRTIVRQELEYVRRSLKQQDRLDIDSQFPTGEKAGYRRNNPVRKDGGIISNDEVDGANEDELFKVLVSGFKERKTIRRKRNKQ